MCSSITTDFVVEICHQQFHWPSDADERESRSLDDDTIAVQLRRPLG